MLWRHRGGQSVWLLLMSAASSVAVNFLLSINVWSNWVRCFLRRHLQCSHYLRRRLLSTMWPWFPRFQDAHRWVIKLRSQAKMRKSIRKRAKKDKSRIHAKLINSTRIEQLSSSMLHPTSIIGITIELSSSPIRPTSKSCHDEDKTTQILIKYLSKSVYNRSPFAINLAPTSVTLRRREEIIEFLS